MTARRRWVMRNGKFVEVTPSRGINRAKPRPRVHLIGDTHEPFRSMADGKVYDSPSAYRRELKARGFEEVGNESIEPTAPPAYNDEGLMEDVATAAAEHGVAVADMPTALPESLDEAPSPFDYQQVGDAP